MDQQYAELQYNRKHGTKHKVFNSNDKVYVKIHNSNHKFVWKPGTVIDRVGNVMYNVYMKQALRNPLVRVHIDQMLTRSNSTIQEDNQIPFNTLIDVFDLKPQLPPVQQDHNKIPITSSASIIDQPEESPSPISMSPEQLRRSTRQRRVPDYLRY